MISKKIIVPLSGGQDSTDLLYYARKIAHFDKIYALSFNYGQRHKIEIDNTKYHCNKLGIEEHKIIDISFLAGLTTNSSLTNIDLKIPIQAEIQGHPQHTAHVNCRNLIFLSLACSWAESVGADTVYHGSAGVDSLAGHWDGSIPFISNLNQLLSLNRKNRITVETPLITKSKKEIIELGQELEVDFSRTWTCYDPQTVYDEVQTFVGLEIMPIGYRSCGICPSCSARIKGFIDAKIKDPLEYNIEIPWYKYGIK